MKTWKIIGVAGAVMALIGLGHLSVGSATEGQSTGHMEQMISEAKTPADHEALAAFYAQEAQAARAKQAEHQQMRDAYATIPVLKTKTGAVAHCNAIAKKYEEIAKEYEALAKMHRDIAKATK